MAPTLREVVAQINATLPADDRWTVERFCKIVNAHDSCNSHLAFPPELQHYERTDPISADLPVYGEIFALVWSNHWPRLDLRVHRDGQELAEEADSWLLLADGFWAFRNGKLTQCEFVDTDAREGVRCVPYCVPATRRDQEQIRAWEGLGRRVFADFIGARDLEVSSRKRQPDRSGYTPDGLTGRAQCHGIADRLLAGGRTDCTRATHAGSGRRVAARRGVSV